MNTTTFAALAAAEAAGLLRAAKEARDRASSYRLCRCDNCRVRADALDLFANHLIQLGTDEARAAVAGAA